MQVSRKVEFECAYIADHELEAHRYQLSVSVDGPQRQQDNGYVISFEELAAIMKESVYDKTFLINTEDYTLPVDLYIVLRRCGVLVVEFHNTLCAEQICKACVNNIQDRLDKAAPGVRVISAKLVENSNSYVSWSRSSDHVESL